MAVDVLQTVMTSEPAGRLYEGLVKRKIAAGAYGMSFALHDRASSVHERSGSGHRRSNAAQFTHRKCRRGS